MVGKDQGALSLDVERLRSSQWVIGVMLKMGRNILTIQEREAILPNSEWAKGQDQHFSWRSSPGNLRGAISMSLIFDMQDILCRKAQSS